MNTPPARVAAVPSLVPVAIVGTMITIAMCVAGWLLRNEADEESVRFLILAFGGPALTGFAGTGFAIARGRRRRELGWLIPATLAIAMMVASPLAHAVEPDGMSVAMAFLGVALAFAVGGLAFAFVGVPTMILLRAAFAEVKPPLAHVWWSVAALIFAASCITVAVAMEDVGTGTSRGRGLVVWFRIFGLPFGEVRNEGALWLTRLLVALAVVPLVLGYRAHKRDSPLQPRTRNGRGGANAAIGTTRPGAELPPKGTDALASFRLALTE